MTSNEISANSKWQTSFSFNKTPAFLNVGTIECFLVKQPIAAIKITEAANHRRFFKKAKSKKVGKIHQN